MAGKASKSHRQQLCPGGLGVYIFLTAVPRYRNYIHNLKIQDNSVHCTPESVRQWQTHHWSACTITFLVESPYISQFYYYPILHHQLTLTVKATLKRTQKYLDQPMCFFRMQKLQRDTKSTNMKCNECNAPPGRKFPAALLKATAICLLYACFREGLINSTLSTVLHWHSKRQLNTA